MSDSPIRVLIVDDQALARTGLRMVLEVEPDLVVVGEATDGEEAVAMAASTAPDVILMDVRMPQMDGLEATRRIVRKDEPGPQVLVLTTFDLDEYVYEALLAGASGFVLKDIPPEQLVEAIHVVASGDALLAPTITRRLIEEFVRRPPEVPGPGRASSTSSRRARPRSCGTSPKACPTRRSRRRPMSASRPSRPTSRAS